MIMKRKGIYILSPESLAQLKRLTPETKDIKDVMALSGKTLISPPRSLAAYPASAASEVPQQKKKPHLSTHNNPLPSLLYTSKLFSPRNVILMLSILLNLFLATILPPIPLPSLTDICEPLLHPQQHKQNSVPTSGFGCWWLTYVYI